MNTFNYDSIPADRPATHKQVKHRAGNIAKEVLLSELGLGGMLVKATNYRLFKQMGMALQTATAQRPLTHGDIQAMGRDASKYLEVFAAAYRELYLTPEELTGLLKQDKVPAAKAKKAVTAYSKLTGKKVVVREKTTDESASVSTKMSGSSSAATKSRKATSKKLTQSEIDKMRAAVDQAQAELDAASDIGDDILGAVVSMDEFLTID